MNGSVNQFCRLVDDSIAAYVQSSRVVDTGSSDAISFWLSLGYNIGPSVHAEDLKQVFRALCYIGSAISGTYGVPIQMPPGMSPAELANLTSRLLSDYAIDRYTSRCVSVFDRNEVSIGPMLVTEGVTYNPYGYVDLPNAGVDFAQSVMRVNSRRYMLTSGMAPAQLVIPDYVAKCYLSISRVPYVCGWRAEALVRLPTVQGQLIVNERPVVFSNRMSLIGGSTIRVENNDGDAGSVAAYIIEEEFSLMLGDRSDPDTDTLLCYATVIEGNIPIYSLLNPFRNAFALRGDTAGVGRIVASIYSSLIRVARCYALL